MIFEKIAFVGFGLIGSSMARAIAEAGTVTKKITAIDTNPEYLEQIVALGIADKVTEPTSVTIAPSFKDGAICLATIS